MKPKSQVILLLLFGAFRYYLSSKYNSHCENSNKCNDENKSWIFGLFCFNKNNPSLLVPKIAGTGYSLNFANPLSWIIVIAIVIFVIFLIVS